jgi:hypothetical protein
LLSNVCLQIRFVLLIETAIDSPRALTSDLSCTGTIIIDEGGILDGNGLTISSEQSPTIVVKNGGTLKNIGITGSAAVGVRFDDNNGAMESVKYDGTGTAVEVVDGSERVTVSMTELCVCVISPIHVSSDFDCFGHPLQVADLASSSAATLVSVTGGSGPVVIDQARYNGNGTGILVDDSEQSVSIQSLHVSGAASAVTVAAADQVSITNLLCYESRECVTASNIMALAMKDSNIMGTSTGHGISFDSLDGDLQLDNLIVRDAALGGLVVANAQNIKIGSSKFLSNGQDGVSIEECVKIVVEDVFAGSNGGNGMDIRCTDVTDDALFQDVALLDNGGTDLSANITLSSTSDDVYFNNVVACGDGSISLNILENQLFVSNLVTDDCNLNGGDNCDQFSNSIVSCEEFCNDSTTLIDSVISSSFSSSD